MADGNPFDESTRGDGPGEAAQAVEPLPSERSNSAARAASSGAKPGHAALDPASPDPAERREIAGWLHLAQRSRNAPARAVATLRAEPDPGRALAAEFEGPALPRALLERWIEQLARAGVRLLPFGHRSYPRALVNLADPPVLLFFRGEPALLSGANVAIVGPRAPSAYGVAAAKRIARAVSARGVAVVSGLARGVDAAAHRAALGAGGRTLAVQACGPPAIYPASHRKLADEIAGSGGVLWEMPPGTPPLAHLFPRRNRLISALARVVVVVEARERSGSLVTARHAMEQGVHVMVVPGPIDRATSVGSNRLLRDGAHPLLAPEDLWGLLGWDPVPLPVGAAEGESAPRLSAAAESILAELLHGPAQLDELCVRLRRAPQELALGLLDLELDGLVCPDRDGRYRARLPPGGAG